MDADDGEAPEVWIVPLARILRHWDPFAAWCTHPVTVEEVEDALEAGLLEPTPYDTIRSADLGSEDEARDYHRRRIAWLVVHRDPTPIEIDVGAPSLGWHPRGGAFDFIDGNHRLCAAVVRGDHAIAVGYGGECDAMARLFPDGWIDESRRAA